MPLFEVAIIRKPSTKEAEDGALETLLYGPVTIIAKDKRIAEFQAIADAQISDTDRLEVLARSFSPF